MTEIAAAAAPLTAADLPFTGPETPIGRYLRTFWHPVYRATELAPGDAVSIRVMSEDWTLYRGESGALHIVQDRCAHRKAKLSVGWVEGEDIRCFYHGWKYGPDGQCVEQPAEPQPFCQKVQLRKAVAHEYLDLVFAYFGEGEPPELPRYPEFENFEGKLTTITSVHGFNYFNAIDNLLDAAHIGFVHSMHVGGFDGKTDSPTLEVEETSWGATSIHTRKTSGKAGQTQFGMPNIFRVRAFPLAPELPPREWIFWLVPIDDESYQRFFVEAMRIPKDKLESFLTTRANVLAKQKYKAKDLAEAVVAGRMRRRDIDPETTNIVNFVDDVAQLSQGRVHDRNGERLGRSDVGVILVRRIWLREATALREGRPLKQWTYDSNLPLIQADE
jgi:5,5'-dehydrodivanillate O-demethylase